MHLEDAQPLDELFSFGNFDVVVNLAAQAGVRYSLTNPGAYIQSNIVGFANVLEADEAGCAGDENTFRHEEWIRRDEG
jgi:UDP-glucuronate 4-epimerase